MKKKFTKLAASIGIALTQSSNADVTIENEYVPIDTNLQLFKPLNSETPIYLAAHRSHKSHSSHGSHRSSSKTKSYSSGSTTVTPTYTAPVKTCPDYLLPSRKSVVSQVQFVLIENNYLDFSDVGTLGIMGYSTRSALKRVKSRYNIKNVPGTVLDKNTLNLLGVRCP
jgi:hypothetical protein